MHSFSSKKAVKYKKTVISPETIPVSIPGFLKNIPHPRNNKEEYKGCLMYL